MSCPSHVLSGGIGVILTGSQERVDYSYAAGAYSELALTSAREKRRASSAAPFPACCFEESLLVGADSELRRAMTLAESVGIEGASDLAKIRSANKD
jgi:hypothetical protein